MDRIRALWQDLTNLANQEKLPFLVTRTSLLVSACILIALLMLGRNDYAAYVLAYATGVGTVGALCELIKFLGVCLTADSKYHVE